MAHEILLDVAHHLERELGGEDAGVLALVFLEDVGLHGAAHRGECPRADLLVLVVGGIAPVVLLEFLDLLVDRGVEEHREDRWRRAVDRHRHRGVGVGEIEARVHHFHVLERRDRHARVAHLAVDVGPLVGLEAVQRDRIEGRGQALGRHVLGQQVEPLVGAERVALAREHAGGVLVLALECKHAGGERERPRHVLTHLPAQDLAVVLVARQRDLGHLRAGERRGGELRTKFLVADLHDVLLSRVRLQRVRPHLEELLGAGVEGTLLLLDQRVDGRIRMAAEHGLGAGQLLALARNAGLILGLREVAPHALCDFG